MTESPLVLFLLVAVLVAALAAVGLLLALLRRRPDDALQAHRDRLEAALREEQREGRAELRQQLDSLGTQQAARIDGFGGKLADLTERTDRRLDEFRIAVAEDARKARLEGAEAQQVQLRHVARGQALPAAVRKRRHHRVPRSLSPLAS